VCKSLTRFLMIFVATASVYLVQTPVPSLAQAPGDGPDIEARRAPQEHATVMQGVPEADVSTDGSGVRSSAGGAGGGVSNRRCGIYDLLPQGGEGLEKGDLPLPPNPSPNPVEGQIYILHCTGLDGANRVDRLITFTPGIVVDDLFEERAQAARARAALDLPFPEIETSPPLGVGQIVGIETWFWITKGWQSDRKTASVPGASATVTATPRSVTYEPGDPRDRKAKVLCSNPPQPWDPRFPDAETDCGYVYVHRSTVGSRDATFSLTATVDYRVTWTASDGVTRPLEDVFRATIVPIRVEEVQAVINS
jgi:hypothetical protein